MVTLTFAHGLTHLHTLTPHARTPHTNAFFPPLPCVRGAFGGGPLHPVNGLLCPQGSESQPPGQMPALGKGRALEGPTGRGTAGRPTVLGRGTNSPIPPWTKDSGKPSPLLDRRA